MTHLSHSPQNGQIPNKESMVQEHNELSQELQKCI